MPIPKDNPAELEARLLHAIDQVELIRDSLGVTVAQSAENARLGTIAVSKLDKLAQDLRA